MKANTELPKPYFSDGKITLYHGDAREILPRLAPLSVDLVLTDPPYGISYVSKSKKPIAGDENLNIVLDAMPLLDRLLRMDRHSYVFAAPMKLGDAVAAISDYWRVKNVVVWDKGNAGTQGDLTAGWGWNWEAVVYAMKGRRELIGPRPRCVYRYDWSAKRDPVHPTVKPVALVSWLMAKSSTPGELVIDPFAGSGPVLRAARDLGRRAIGIELDEDYCKATVKRLSEGA